MLTVAEVLMSIEMGSIYGIVAMGIYLSFRVIDFPDLTCDGSFVLGAAVSTMLAQWGANPVLALCAAFIAGALAGILTGGLHTKGRIPDLLSGIIVAFMLYAVNLRVMGGVPNRVLPEEHTFFGVFPNISPALLLILVGVGVWAIASAFLHTDWGLALRSIGQNTKLARACGVRVKSYTIFGLAFSNALVGLGGGLFSHHQAMCDVSLGAGTIIVGLAAVILGEKIVPFKAPWLSLLGCFVGSIVYRFFISLALRSDFLGLEAYDLNLVIGTLLLIIMIVPRYVQKMRVQGGCSC